MRINQWVNDTVKPMTDMDHWGVVERWNYPDDGYGDCEDYVLLKRKMLMQAGWPREALLITVVRDKNDDGHAVLTVKTDKGEYILDNQTDDIVLWSDTGYRFVKRQSQSDPNVWVALGEPRPVPLPPQPRTDGEPNTGATRARSRPHPSPSPDRVRARPAPPPRSRPHLFLDDLFAVGPQQPWLSRQPANGATISDIADKALAMTERPTGTVTFLITDIEQSTRRWEEQPRCA